MKRLLTSLVAVATLLGSAAACTNPIDPPAAVVDGDTVSRSEFMGELKAVARAVAELQGEPFDAARLSQDITNSWLTFRVASLLIDQGVARYDLTVGEDDLAGAGQADAVSLLVESNPDLAELNRRRLGRVGALDRYLRDTIDAGKPWWTDDDARSVARHLGLLSANEGLDALEDAERAELEETLQAVTSLDTWLILENRARKVNVDRRFGTWNVAQVSVVSPPGPLQRGGNVDLASLFGGG